MARVAGEAKYPNKTYCPTCDKHNTIEWKCLHQLLVFAEAHKLHITSTLGGMHNVGSLHYIGRAIDVRSLGLSDSEVEELKRVVTEKGWRLRDERTHPVHQRVWNGPHLHIEVPITIKCD